MGRKKLTQSLKVFMGSSQVGVFSKRPQGAVSFRYSEAWIETGFPISLSMPLVEKEFKGDKVSFYFDNLLPDNKIVLEAIAKKVQASSIQQFDLLKAVGRECVGALSFFAEDREPVFLSRMHVRPLRDEEIAHRIRGLASGNPLGMGDDGDFRLSLAGAQEKMALLFRKGKWYEPKGQTATSHILKKKMGLLAGGINFEKSVDNECICLFLARKFGIDVCSAEIVEFADQRVLSVERFDRQWENDFLYRVPQEDFCQALGVSPQGKYERQGGPSLQDMMKVLLSSNNAEKDRKNLFKTALFNDLICNTDGHAKNVSLFHTPQGFALTPMYDLLSAHFLQKQNAERYAGLRSSLSINGKYKYAEITLKDWEKEAKKCQIGPEQFQEICAELKSSVTQLDLDGVPLRADPGEFSIIAKGLKRRAKLLFGL